MNKNILLISENQEIINIVNDKLHLLRKTDEVTVCSFSQAKKLITESNFKIIIPDFTNKPDIKLIENIKSFDNDAKIIIFLNSVDKKFIFSAYDLGIYDYLTTDDDDFVFTIKLMNCLKFIGLKDKFELYNELLETNGIIKNKTKMIKLNSIREIFDDLKDDKDFQNSVFAIITLDSNVKTKISNNRLANIINKNIRINDISSESNDGLFYVIFKNTQLTDAKFAIQKIQNLIGEELPIRSGINKIGIQSFEELNKNTKDSLLAASKNNEICVSLKDNLENADSWLDDGQAENKNKKFKLFNISYQHKLKNIIEPIFFKFQKDCSSKMKDTTVIQYANEIESVFSLKDNIRASELVIRYDGYTKLFIQIIHKGLDSPENSKIEISLNKFGEKELNKYLKQLKQDFYNRI